MTEVKELDLKCDVCDKHAVGVACSPFGAVSFAYCIECLNKPADPFMMFDYLFEDVSNEGEGMHSSMNTYYSFLKEENRYISWPEFVERKRNGEWKRPDDYYDALENTEESSEDEDIGELFKDTE